MNNFVCSHHMISASEIDTAATEFDRRFHISVDETEDQGNQVRTTRVIESQVLLVDWGLTLTFPLIYDFFFRIRFGLGFGNENENCECI